jgi:hypothetical protein
MRKKISYFMALAAMMITVAAVWYAHRPYEPKQATWVFPNLKRRKKEYSKSFWVNHDSDRLSCFICSK